MMTLMDRCKTAKFMRRVSTACFLASSLRILGILLPVRMAVCYVQEDQFSKGERSGFTSNDLCARGMAFPHLCYPTAERR